MKRLALFTACMSLVLAAHAQQADAPATTSDSAAALETTEDQQQAADKQARDDMADRNCLKYTGSRLISADRHGRKCANAPGRAYTRDDLERTGAVDLADALRMLDPAIR